MVMVLAFSFILRKAKCTESINFYSIVGSDNLGNLRSYMDRMKMNRKTNILEKQMAGLSKVITGKKEASWKQKGKPWKWAKCKLKRRSFEKLWVGCEIRKRKSGDKFRNRTGTK